MRTLLLGAGLAFLCPAVAAACPVISTGLTEIYLSEADLASPYGAYVVAGGDQDLSRCGFAAGYVISTPDFSFHLADVYGPVQVWVESPGCDTVLLVNAPDGSWWYDDDSGGDLQPWLQITTNPGRMDVWVGTFSGGFCDANVVLN